MLARGSVWSMILASALFLCGSAAANDSMGFQGTTGIALTTTADIRMVSEDLRISPDEIRVDYVFRNESDHPVESLVVFPLPDLDLAPGLTASNWAFPARTDNFLGFRLWVDGEARTPTLERRGFYRGRDVTAELKETGALELLVPWRDGAYDSLAAKLAPAALDRLRRDGLIRQGDDDNNPQWVLRNQYFWRQSFPVGRGVRVRHVYRPFVGSIVPMKLAELDTRGVVGRYVGAAARPDGDRYCLDGATRRTLATIQARHPDAPLPFTPRELEYILTTARNWRGPIGRFHLTIDKGRPDNIVSLCWNGLTKTGPTTFETTIENFVPDHDIRLLILDRGA